MGNGGVEGAFFHAGLYLVAGMEVGRIADGATVVQCNAVATGQQYLRVEALQLERDTLQQVFLGGQTTLNGYWQAVSQ